MMDGNFFVVSAMSISGAAALLFAIPQVMKIRKTRHTHSFSLLTWGMWWLNQLIYTAYAITIRAWMLVLFGLGWLVFHSVMLWMIIEYRKPGKGKK